MTLELLLVITRPVKMSGKVSITLARPVLGLWTVETFSKFLTLSPLPVLTLLLSLVPPCKRMSSIYHLANRLPMNFNSTLSSLPVHCCWWHWWSWCHSPKITSDWRLSVWGLSSCVTQILGDVHSPTTGLRLSQDAGSCATLTSAGPTSRQTPGRERGLKEESLMGPGNCRSEFAWCHNYNYPHYKTKIQTNLGIK